MSKMIQIRNVPEALHRKLKSRAAMEGMSLSDYLLKASERTAEVPTLAELKARLARLKPLVLKPPAAAIIRAERERR